MLNIVERIICTSDGTPYGSQNKLSELLEIKKNTNTEHVSRKKLPDFQERYRDLRTKSKSLIREVYRQYTSRAEDQMKYEDQDF